MCAHEHFEIRFHSYVTCPVQLNECLTIMWYQWTSWEVMQMIKVWDHITYKGVMRGGMLEPVCTDR
jgi:hypothetical protein